MLTVRYRVEPDDIATFGVSACTRNGQMRNGRLFLAYLTMCLAFIVGAAVAMGQSTKARFVASFIVFLLMGACVAYASWRSYPKSIRKNMLKQETPAISPTLFGDLSLSVAEGGLTVEHALSTTHLKWAAVRELVETPEHLFLMVSPIRGYVVPKASLTGATLAELAAEIRRHLRSTSPPDDDPGAWSTSFSDGDAVERQAR